jgi:hypothetical protein
MKAQKLLAAFAAASLSISLAATVASAAPRSKPELKGSPAPLAAAQRSVVISPNTKFVNVKGGEVVRFSVNDQAFAWNFAVGSNVSAIDLRQIAPPGLLERKVMVYVAPDLRYYP